MQSDPELYRNEGPFGHIPGIPVFSTWENRQVQGRVIAKLTNNGT